MTRKTFYFSFAILFAFMITACSKVSESLERDVIVRPDEIKFDIKPVDNTQSGRELAKIPVTMKFDSLIRNQTGQEMGIENVKNFTVTSFQLVIDSVKDDNNFGNFETINVSMVSSSQPEVLVAEITGNPSSKNGRLTLDLPPNLPELKGFMTSPSFQFVLKGKARNPTTIVLNVKARISYALKVGR